MSDPNPSKRPGPEFENAVNRQLAARTEPSAAGSGAETEIYMEEEGAYGPAMNPAWVPPPPRALSYVPRTYDDAYIAARRAAEANLAQQLTAARGTAMTFASTTPFGRESFVTSVQPGGTGRVFLRQKVLPIDNDPLVKQLALQEADVKAKIQALAPALTYRQNTILTKRMGRITTVTKGKKAGDQKLPTGAQLNKVLFRAIEMHAKRRAAQLGAQARRARRERHALQQKGRVIALPDGTSVGFNKRAYKKSATSAIQQAANFAAKNEKKQLRDQLTANNKKNRVDVATSHGRKVNPKDLK
jgi:hypothetical protein